MAGNSTSLFTIRPTSNSICLFSNLFPNGAFKTFSNPSLVSLRFKHNTFLSSSSQSQTTHFIIPSLSPKRCNLFPVHALKKQKRNHRTALLEMRDMEEDSDDDELEAFDDDFIDDDDGEDEGMFLPFGKMKKWLENKPRGFGEGKVYDTSIEDKLLEEIEHSRKAQPANLNNLKNNPAMPKLNQNKKKVVEVVPTGIHVRVLNLPKKKNIHRDLQLAFREVAGIVNIIPAVSGNKKTKDPICKGFAFVDFKSEDDAHRFVRQFSGQSVAFGGIQKQIKCMMASSDTSSSSVDESAGSFSSGSNLIVPGPEDTNANFDTDNSSLEETSYDVRDDTDELTTENLQDVTDSLISFSMTGLDDDSMEPTAKPTVDSFSQKKQIKRQSTKKKVTVKDRVETAPKLEIPGSAKRLKIKEKAMLVDVFSKYRSRSAMASVEES